MDNFFNEYQLILRMALTSGVPFLPSGFYHHYPPKFTHKDRINFLRGCHRGFERAQNSILDLICKINIDASLNQQEKEFRSLLLRKVLDAIVYTIFSEQLHVLRRFVLHNFPPHLNIDEAKKLLMIANKYNAESRQIFAIVSDLTTCVHVGDIVLIDHRGRPKIELIEIKSGAVNTILTDFLDHFENSNKVLNSLKECPAIPEQFRKQTLRMMKQRIRLSQVAEVISKEKGVDIKFNKPISFSKYTYEIDCFDEFVTDICNRTCQDKIAGGVVDDCIHVCAAIGNSRDDSFLKAHKSIFACLKMHRKNNSVIVTNDERLSDWIPRQESIKIFNPILSNLYACACRPFPLWGIERENLMKILSGRLGVAFAFDLSGFIFTAESLGLNIKFGSKRETDDLIKKLDRLTVPVWGKRMIKLCASGKEVTLLSGTFSRFINDLVYPSHILQVCKNGFSK